MGDKLIAEVKSNKVVLKPKKQVFMDALAEIQRIVKESGIPEKEMQDNLKKIRKQIYEERYAKSIS